MFNIIKLFICNVLLFPSSTHQMDYTGYKIYEIQNNENVHKKLLELVEVDAKNNFLDLLMINPNTSHVLAAPDGQKDLEKALTKMDAEYKEQKDDVQSQITNEKKSTRHPKGFFEEFHSYEEIQAYIKVMVKRFSNIATYESIGRTYKKLDISIVRISHDKKPKSKMVYIQAGLHAREWIAPAVALYSLTYLLQKFKKLSSCLNDVEIVIAPLVNPDGYRYSRNTERMWRKNREPIAGSECIGVDLNRNFDFHWNETTRNSSPCMPSYAGPKATSTREVSAISKFLQSNKNRLKGFIDLHSYGSLLFHPYGYKKNTFYKREQHESMASLLTMSFRYIRGQEYFIGTSANLIYASSGTAYDYAAGVLDVSLVFCIELPHNSFFLDDNEIYPICKDTNVGLMEFITNIEDL